MPALTTSSSPRPDRFSDDAVPHSSTPPSSPPGFPWEHTDASAGQNQTVMTDTKNVFSLLGKRKALDAISDNVRPTKRVAMSKARIPTTTKLTQMQISLGQVVQKNCKICGMEYVPSSAEDRKLHDKFHRQNTEGFDVGKDFVSKASAHAVFSGLRKDDAICIVDCFSPHTRKRKGQAVLEIVQRELGAVHIPEDELWDSKAAVNDRASMTGKYRTYLYIRGTKCVGCLLVQSITAAYTVLDPNVAQSRGMQARAGLPATAAGALKARQEAATQQLKQPLQLSDDLHAAELGVSRIWTSPHFRHQDIATRLLDAACLTNQQGRHAAKDRTQDGAALPTNPDQKGRVAFSQPTEAGTRLARRWFGKAYGWKAYLD